MNSPHSTNKKTKSLRWAPVHTTHYTISLRNLSDDERSRTWYDREDYRAFHDECCDVIRLLRKYGNADALNAYYRDQVVCGRGLERKIDQELCARQVRAKKVATATVLEEQSDQRYFGTHCPDFLAELYEDVTSPCRREAHRRGLEDQKEALACLMDLVPVTKKKKKKTSSKVNQQLLTSPQLLRSGIARTEVSARSA